MKILTTPQSANLLSQVLRGVEITSEAKLVSRPVAILWDKDTDGVLRLLSEAPVAPDFVILSIREGALEPIDFQEIDPINIRMERTEDILRDPFAVNVAGDVYDAFCAAVETKLQGEQATRKVSNEQLKQVIGRFVGLQIPDFPLLVSAVATYGNVSNDEALEALSQLTTVEDNKLVWRDEPA